MTKLTFSKLASSAALATAVSLFAPGFAQSSLAQVPQVSDAERETIVGVMNGHRREAIDISDNISLEPVTWSPRLAQVAQYWVNQFAEENGFPVDDPPSIVTNEVGNELDQTSHTFWWGSAGRFTVADMVNGWVDTANTYEGGAAAVLSELPSLSREDISRADGPFGAARAYAIVVSPEWTHVGCGKTVQGGRDVLYCLYGDHSFEQ